MKLLVQVDALFGNPERVMIRDSTSVVFNLYSQKGLMMKVYMKCSRR